MALAATSAISALEQIQSISMRAVFGGFLLILCCLIVVGLFKNNIKISYATFLILVGVVALVSGILLAGAVYVTQNPNMLTIWNISL